MRPGICPSCFTIRKPEAFEHAQLGGGQKFGEHVRVEPARPRDVEQGRLVEADDLPGRADAQLAAVFADQQKERVLLFRAGRMLPVGAAIGRFYSFAAGAGAFVLAAPFAVVGPSAVAPAAESPDPFFAAVSSTCRRVNSWKNRSPTG